MPAGLIPVIIAVVLVVAAVVLFKLMWRVAEPNEAMIISGLSNKGGEGFRIVTGKGTLVIPGMQAVRRLKLNLHEASLQVQCVTQQGIPVSVYGTVIYKIADDNESIANAARRFLGQQEAMDGQVHSVFAGHLRSIVGGLTMEDLIRNREALESQTREAAGKEMAQLGFRLDALKIQEIDDPTNYIKNLAAPHIAEVQKNARIAQANNNREAAQQEAAATAQVAEAERDSHIKQAGYQAEVQQAQAKAAQAGPLADAQARQGVVEQETAVAKLEAERTERQLDAQVRRPADAAQYQRVAQAQGEREASILAAEAEAQRIKLSAEAQALQTQQVGQAEGAAITAKGEAEGKALKAKAEGLAANNDAVIGQQLAGQMVEVVKAAAGAFQHVDNLTVLNGASGLMESLNSIISQSMASLPTIRRAMNPSTNGHAEQVTETITETPQV